MNSYYCIVNMPGVPAREIRVLDVRDDHTAGASAHEVAAEWFGYDTLCVYQGERLVEVLSNPSMGFPTEPFDLSCETVKTLRV